MKKLIPIIAILLCLGFFAYLMPYANFIGESTDDLFCIVAEGKVSGFRQQIMYDPDTMVMYTSIAGKIEVLYNVDGSYRLYSPDDEVQIFVPVADGYVDRDYQTIMYDPSTSIMYSVFKIDRWSRDVCVMYNADGSYKLYSPDSEFTS